MMTAISAALAQLITMIGSVITAVVGEDGALGALLPVFALGIAVSLIMLTVKIIRSFTWGA